MELIGVHISRSPTWPIVLQNPQKVPSSAVLFHTCNRVQYLCEGPERKAILECFREAGVDSPTISTDRECVRELFRMAFGLNSVNYGNTIIRKQMLEAKNLSGTPRIKKVISDVTTIAEEMVPYRGFRQFKSALRFMNLMGIKNVHIVTGGETIGMESYPVWHPDAFKCDGVILAGRYDTRYYEAIVPMQCKYCINFNTRFDPVHFMNVTPLFDSYVSFGDPVIQNTDPIADLYWEKFECDLSKRKHIERMKTMGISSGEIEAIFSKELVKLEL